MVDNKVNSFTYFEHRSGGYVLPHEHDSFELVYYIVGDGEISIDGEKHIYHADTISITRPRVVHDEINQTDTKVYIMLFSLEPRIKLDNIILHLEPEPAKRLKRIIEDIGDEFREKRRNYINVMALHMRLALYEVFRVLDKGKPAQKYYRENVSHVKEYIRENCTQDIDFKMLVKSLGYSYDRFRHVFKTVTGDTLNNYLLEQRMTKSKGLLYTTDMSVKDIAAAAGFSSLSYFEKFFRKRMNMTPGEYRRIFWIENPIGIYQINEKEPRY
jgi:AraC family transcriptional activator of pobA